MACFRLYRDTPFRTLVRPPLPRDMNAADLAIANHVEVGAVVPRGTRLKLTR